MGEHRTAKSIATINGVIRVAESLSYNVRTEWKIPGTEPHSEQIDIALFVDENARVPAFAVEVDSTDAPSSTSNAVKIFGKSTSVLVKPFFVFHIFLESATQGHRRTNTTTLLSTHNYGTYDFAGPEDRERFLLDLLDRHRALRSTISVLDFGCAIDDPVWDGTDRYGLLDRAAGELTCHSELAERAGLSIQSRNLQDSLPRLICSGASRRISTADVTFAGQHFLWPIIFGVRAYAGDPVVAAQAFQKLRDWQEGPEIIFNPRTTLLGLSRDFDFAIVELAPPMFCLVALLFQKQLDAARQICEQLYSRAIDDHLGSVWARYALAWCVLASIKVKALVTAQAALNKIEELGGLPKGVFPRLAGPRIAQDEDAEWEVLLCEGTPSRIPSLSAITAAISSLRPAQCSLIDLVARLLIDNKYALEMHRDLICVAGN